MSLLVETWPATGCNAELQFSALITQQTSTSCKKNQKHFKSGGLPPLIFRHPCKWHSRSCHLVAVDWFTEILSDLCWDLLYLGQTSALHSEISTLFWMAVKCKCYWVNSGAAEFGPKWGAKKGVLLTLLSGNGAKKFGLKTAPHDSLSKIDLLSFGGQKVGGCFEPWSSF